jgi:hypothetical protein
MAKRGVVLTEQEAMEVIAEDAGIHIDNDGNIREQDATRTRGRMRDTQYEQRMASLQRRLTASPAVPATVFNFLPFTVKMNSILPSTLGGVPAAQGSSPYSTRTWRRVDIQVHNDGDSGRTPHDFHPYQIAEAFEKEFPHGGVVALHGGPEAADTEEGKARLREGAAKATTWMLGQLEQANRFWNAPDRFQRRNVSNTHKACAHRLHDLRIIKALPEYVTDKIDLGEGAPKACAQCGATPPNRGALKCQCGYILDPEAAFLRNVIPEDHESLERLTRPQVEALGISAYVAETSDEAQERRKHGLPKPPSMANLRVMEDQEEEEKRKAKK